MTLKNPRIWVLLAAFAAAPAFAQNIAVVNGTPIPKARVDALVAQLVQQGQQDTPQLQAAVREELVNREILMQEAARRGIADASGREGANRRRAADGGVARVDRRLREEQRADRRRNQGALRRYGEAGGRRQGISPAPHSRRRRSAGEGPDREDQGRRELRGSGEAVFEGPGIGQERRRSGLVEPAGLRAGVRRRGAEAEEG